MSFSNGISASQSASNSANDIASEATWWSRNNAGLYDNFVSLFSGISIGIFGSGGTR